MEYRKLTELKKLEGNPRVIRGKQFKTLVESIRANPQHFEARPLILSNRTGELVIIAGNQRYEAAKSLKLKEVPTFLIEGLTEEKEKEIVIRDNVSNGEWDMDALSAWDNLPLADWGVDLPADWLAPTNDPHEDNFDVDEAAAAIAEPTAKTGDVWLLGRHRVMCGDSTKKEDVARLMADKKADIMVTDPPYGVEYDPNWRNEYDRVNGKPYGARAIGKVTNDDKNDWREAWNLFLGNVAYVWHADRHAKKVQESLESAGFEIRSQIIWAKNNMVISRGHYHWQHEPCWYAFRKGEIAGWIGDRKQTTLWNIDKLLKNETGHSTQKPIECMARPIKNHSGDVYDPFLGSGTTLIAAEQLNRICYGMEIDPLYLDVIIKRWETLTGQKATLEAAP